MLFLADGSKGFKEGGPFSNLYKGTLWTVNDPGSKELSVKAKQEKNFKQFVGKTHTSLVPPWSVCYPLPFILKLCPENHMIH